MIELSLTLFQYYEQYLTPSWWDNVVLWMSSFLLNTDERTLHMNPQHRGPVPASCSGSDVRQHLDTGAVHKWCHKEKGTRPSTNIRTIWWCFDLEIWIHKKVYFNKNRHQYGNSEAPKIWHSAVQWLKSDGVMHEQLLGYYLYKHDFIFTWW